MKESVCDCVECAGTEEELWSGMGRGERFLKIEIRRLSLGFGTCAF